MAEAQKMDKEVQIYRTGTSSLEPKTFHLVSMVLICCVICLQVNPGLLFLLCGGTEFVVLHRLSNTSVQATKKLIASKFVWKELKKEAGEWDKQYVACQSSKVQTHIRAPLKRMRQENRTSNVWPVSHRKSKPTSEHLWKI